MKHFVFFGLLAALPAFAADPILPLERQAAWQGNVGIPGGIPVYPVCVNVRNGPFNAVGDGLHDDSQAIQAAIAACTNGGAVYLPIGTYLVSTNVIIPPGYPFKLPSIALRGDGPGLTTIALGSYNNEPVIEFKQGTVLGYPTAITAGLTQGSSSINLSAISTNGPNGNPIKVGMIISISELTDTNFVNTNASPEGHIRRANQQFARVTNISGTTLGITPPLVWPYSPALLPQAQVWGMITNCGVESMTVTRLHPSTNSYGNAHCIEFNDAAWCWVTNVETSRPQGAHIQFLDCFQCQVEYCYCHDGWTQCSGQDYGVWIFDYNSHHLIENTIFKNIRHAMIFEAGGAGCVFGYNFSTNAIAGENADNFPGDDQLTHGAHPWFNLYEGNVAVNISGDDAHGSASHNTYFREYCYLTDYLEPGVIATNQNVTNLIGTENANGVDNSPRYFPAGYTGGWIVGPVPVTNPWTMSQETPASYGVSFQQWTLSNNLVGCVFSTNNTWFPFLFAATNTSQSVPLGHGSIVILGAADGATEFGHLMADNVVGLSTYWHGNFDPVNNATVWVATNADHVLPASLYLTSKPSWWDASAWPPIGPDLSPMVGTIPAQLRMQQWLNPPLLAPGKLHIVKGS